MESNLYSGVEEHYIMELSGESGQGADNIVLWDKCTKREDETKISNYLRAQLDAN